jgi:hypothetical protein
MGFEGETSAGLGSHKRYWEGACSGSPREWKLAPLHSQWRIMYRGSRKHVLDWVEHRRFVPDVLSLVQPAEAVLTSAAAWLPLGYRYPDEARLEEWGRRYLSSSGDWDALQSWWLASPRGANTPNWDLAVVAQIETTLGLILVEAKANAPELSTAGKDAPSGSLGSKANHERIGQAIADANEGLRQLTPSIHISRDSHYQLANRIAFTWKLAALGIPTVLVYLGFIGDTGIADAGHPLESDAHWNRLLNTHLDEVGAAALFEKRQCLGGAPFWLLARSRPVLRPSEPAAA